MNMLDDYLPMQETLSSENYIIATYLIKIEKNDSSLKHAIEIAIDQTTGTWTLAPEETEEVKATHRAKVIGIYEIPSYENILDYKYCVLQIAYPHINFGPSIAMLFSTVLGNNSSMGFVKLIDLTFPEKYIKNFKGCKFGVEGIRRLANVYYTVYHLKGSHFFV